MDIKPAYKAPLAGIVESRLQILVAELNTGIPEANKQTIATIEVKTHCY
jgi:hypothetical protein